MNENTDHAVILFGKTRQRDGAEITIRNLEERGLGHLVEPFTGQQGQWNIRLRVSLDEYDPHEIYAQFRECLPKGSSIQLKNEPLVDVREDYRDAHERFYAFQRAIKAVEPVMDDVRGLGNKEKIKAGLFALLREVNPIHEPTLREARARPMRNWLRRKHEELFERIKKM